MAGTFSPYPSLQEPESFVYVPAPIPTVSSDMSSSSKLKIVVEGAGKSFEMPLKEKHTVKRVQELVSQKLTIPEGREVIVKKTDGTLLELS